MSRRDHPISTLDDVVAHEVAHLFLTAQSRPDDPIVATAYRALERETDRMFTALTTGRHAYRIVFTDCRTPYDSDVELIRAVRSTRLLEITTHAVERDAPHPVFAHERGGAYDRFRAVHDLIGHVRYGFGFDRQGEFAAWQVQEPMHTPIAQLALATELHAEHSVRWTTNVPAEHKAWVLPRDVLDRSRRGVIDAHHHSALVHANRRCP